MNILEALQAVDPAALQYQDWINVGMALQYEGFAASDWDNWSKADTARYHPGECYRKWAGFAPDKSATVTGGTIIALAKQQGWQPSSAVRALDWDDMIYQDDLAIIDPAWVEAKEVREPGDDWDAVSDMVRYLQALFDADDHVSYVNEAWHDDKKGKWHPAHGGHCDRTAEQLISALQSCGGDIGAVLGDYNPDAGAWVRFNPMAGSGATNDDVADYRYALVESDDTDLDKQHAILLELELPIAALVYSGNHSLHAIVRVDAIDYHQYKERVNYLYDVCGKNGLIVDTQNKNPSRLSRLPGVWRNGHKQFLVATQLGKKNWSEWQEWIEGVNDDLPDPESLSTSWDNMPDLAPPLIDGVLRQGHKMLLAGPSKAGKSYALIELCIAIAEGTRWLNTWECAQGRVLYVNLELDRASCLHRFRDVYQAMGLPAKNIAKIDLWNLRGHAVPMDKLAPKLIRRAQKRDYIAVVIDPIYKVITGDENSADQMAHFTNQFDKICTQLGTAVIYCHHHSKGYQGNKRSMDRASGSGVFARDPDAMLDLTELELTNSVTKLLEDRYAARQLLAIIKQRNPHYAENSISQDDELSRFQMIEHAQRALDHASDAIAAIDAQATKAASLQTAWRIETTLREFPKTEPLNIWFRYPIHEPDDAGLLADLSPEGDVLPWQRAMDKRKPPEKKKEERQNALEIAFSSLEMDGNSEITISQLAQEMGISKPTVWRRLKEHGGFKTEKQSDNKESIVKRKEK